MRFLLILITLLILEGCASKSYMKKQMLPEDIKSLIEETYSVENNQRKLLQKKQIDFTKNGRIKTSKTYDSLGNVMQETEKRLWFVKESYPNKKPYYCKTRWKSNLRERISCYSQKKYKQNESIYHYNKDGTIFKIVDNFTTYNTQYFYYKNNELSKILITNKNEKLIDEILISCETKDNEGTCIKQVRVSSFSNSKREILRYPTYN